MKDTPMTTSDEARARESATTVSETGRLNQALKIRGVLFNTIFGYTGVGDDCAERTASAIEDALEQAGFVIALATEASTPEGEAAPTPPAREGGPWHYAHDEKPAAGSRVVVAYEDGSGAFLGFWTGDAFIEGDGDETVWRDEPGTRWAYLPQGFQLWCEIRSDDPFTFPAQPSLTSTPSPAPVRGHLRAKVARIVDPYGFEKHAAHNLAGERRRKDAFATADAILAALTTPNPPASEAGSGEVERGMIDMLTRDHKRMRNAGTILAEAALRVVREYDGLHRLALAVASWSAAIADEGDRAALAHSPEVEK
jgi:hypothetical protein